MSDEEKIKQLEKKLKELDKENQGLFELYNFNDTSLLAKILKEYKNTIEKQQKEIEELKDIEQQICNEELFTKEYVDKLRKEIEELKENECVYKDTSSCTKALSFKAYKKLNDIDKKWKDKIKAKIEEIDKSYEDSKNEDGESEYYYPNYTVEVLQSLLEKE